MRLANPAWAAVLLALPVAALAQDAPAEKPEEAPFTVHLDKAVVEIDGRKIPATAVTPPRREFLVQGVRIEIDGGTFRAFRGEARDPAWTATAEGADAIQVLDDSPSRLITRWWKKGESDAWTCLGGEGLLRPLALADGKWGPTMVLGEGEDKGMGAGVSLQSVEDGPAGTAVLCWVEGTRGGTEVGGDSWRVAFLPTGTTKPAWIVTRPSAGSFPPPAWMRGDGGGYHRADLRGLSFAGDALVVCAGPLQDILVLDTAAGRERARLSKAWEFRPGKPAPPSLPTATPPVRDESRAALESKPDGGPRSCILAGPVVLAHRERPEYGDRPVDGFRIFVGTAVDHLDIQGYAMDGYLLELDADLRPVAMSALPNLPEQTLEIEGSRSADFALESGGILRVTPSFQREVHGSKEMGTGHRVRIALMHEPAPVFRDGYLTTGHLGVFFADARGTLTTSAGGTVATKDSGEFVLPFEVFDFAGKGERAALLRIPIAGPPPKPQTNYSESLDPSGGSTRIDSKDPHIAVIRGFRRTGGKLQIQVWAAGKGTLEVVFDLGKD